MRERVRLAQGLFTLFFLGGGTLDFEVSRYLSEESATTQQLCIKGGSVHFLKVPRWTSSRDISEMEQDIKKLFYAI